MSKSGKQAKEKEATKKMRAAKARECPQCLGRLIHASGTHGGIFKEHDECESCGYVPSESIKVAEEPEE